MEEKGLIQKYIVFKADDQTIITDCFVLRPEKELAKGSKAAIAAIRAYAETTENKSLAEDLVAWMNNIECKDRWKDVALDDDSEKQDVE